MAQQSKLGPKFRHESDKVRRRQQWDYSDPVVVGEILETEAILAGEYVEWSFVVRPEHLQEARLPI